MVGADPGGNKLSKAQELGTRQIDEKELLRLLGRRSEPEVILRLKEMVLMSDPLNRHLAERMAALEALGAIGPWDLEEVLRTLTKRKTLLVKREPEALVELARKIYLESRLRREEGRA